MNTSKTHATDAAASTAAGANAGVPTDPGIAERDHMQSQAVFGRGSRNSTARRTATAIRHAKMP